MSTLIFQGPALHGNLENGWVRSAERSDGGNCKGKGVRLGVWEGGQVESVYTNQSRHVMFWWASITRGLYVTIWGIYTGMVYLS